MRISDWSSDVCSSDLPVPIAIVGIGKIARDQHIPTIAADPNFRLAAVVTRNHPIESVPAFATITDMATAMPEVKRSEEHTSELQSLMRISYAVFCLKKKKNQTAITR